ncbi:MAG TPA: AbrB/MazE/SpoVT family DNA-binding domain-containing protein, partial [Skermanella sp.]|nr:AbrB/MazE/SpoVT family DNA-binding domain-containing protein [Skermanella sp.]
MIELICSRSFVLVILDTGIRTASDATVEAGLAAREAGRMPKRTYGEPSSPQLGLIARDRCDPDCSGSRQPLGYTADIMEGMMQVQLARWGNSLGLRIPKELAGRLGLKDGARVEIEAEGDR